MPEINTKTEIKFIDFGKLCKSDILTLDLEDPMFLLQIGLQPVPDYSHLEPKNQYEKYLKYYKTLIQSGVQADIDTENTFKALTNIAPNFESKEYIKLQYQYHQLIYTNRVLKSQIEKTFAKLEEFGLN